MGSGCPLFCSKYCSHGWVTRLTVTVVGQKYYHTLPVNITKLTQGFGIEHSRKQNSLESGGLFKIPILPTRENVSYQSTSNAQIHISKQLKELYPTPFLDGVSGIHTKCFR
ncbi:hypothetical protein AO1008_02211 [Aspergillus oryzae 100-8]|uniref:Uncharacterized protein n=1 Tax=Aspergillus oryzae (strain 3.042) TaxID=1160506 RepID=I8TP74_ASPO3|nr:hypothetical protein Ao3042_07883 [Aspergillus oryzae 3.042]KDE76516.1 hypothetical protein AO1008_02211 [Aspergillus oryzae 100-8]|eukprot:EIT76000.1 hypothetical protein Ao3042_07883 [Aspergillus oryzae 3.042]